MEVSLDMQYDRVAKFRRWYEEQQQALDILLEEDVTALGEAAYAPSSDPETMP